MPPCRRTGTVKVAGHADAVTVDGAVGLGRAALIAVDTDPEEGLVNLVECLLLEL